MEVKKNVRPGGKKGVAATVLGKKQHCTGETLFGIKMCRRSVINSGTRKFFDGERGAFPPP